MDLVKLIRLYPHKHWNWTAILSNPTITMDMILNLNGVGTEFLIIQILP